MQISTRCSNDLTGRISGKGAISDINIRVTAPNGNPNGEIERFKLELHGKGLSNCGLLTYVEDESFKIWLQRINEWIIELIPSWSKKEKLKFISEQENLAYLNSITIRQTDELKLHHFWIDIKDMIKDCKILFFH